MDPAKWDDAKREDEHLSRSTEREKKAEKEKELPCSSSSADGLSEEDEDDFFQLDPAELTKSLVSPQGPNAAARNVGEQSYRVTSSSPPVQTMERFEVPDPHRIPSSIFARTKSTAPMEWSMASNDSLFSIHVGNPSFPREQPYPVGYRSQDFNPHYGNPTEYQKLQISGVSSSGSGGIDPYRKMKEPNAAVEMKAKGIKEEGPPPKGFLSDTATYPVNMSRESDASLSSFQSFAFPILTGEGRNSSAKVEPTEPVRVHQEKPVHHPPPEPEPPKPAPSGGKRKWLSCFCCCSSCF